MSKLGTLELIFGSTDVAQAKGQSIVKSGDWTTKVAVEPRPQSRRDERFKCHRTCSWRRLEEQHRISAACHGKHEPLITPAT